MEILDFLIKEYNPNTDQRQMDKYMIYMREELQNMNKVVKKFHHHFYEHSEHIIKTIKFNFLEIFKEKYFPKSNSYPKTLHELEIYTKKKGWGEFRGIEKEISECFKHIENLEANCKTLDKDFKHEQIFNIKNNINLLHKSLELLIKSKSDYNNHVIMNHYKKIILGISVINKIINDSTTTQEDMERILQVIQSELTL
ncbi:hypothetical protein K9M79_06415 [Candidatus Woesearchaeota archaeon]|nr:hypothetical protein [Candidatus Woesearchaeota archaeon]